MKFRNGSFASVVGMPLGGLFLAGLAVISIAGCGGPSEEVEQEAPQGMEPVTLGPVDGFDLPPNDLDRVSVGTLAPDFTLRTISGEDFSLSALRGSRNVVLVFYRGHW